MPIIIIFLVVGAILAYISQHNFMLVSLSIGPYLLENLPLFYVIVGSLITGFVLSYLIHLYQSISPFFVLRGTKNELQHNKDDVLELTKRVHQLELENERLKRTPGVEPEDRNAL